MGGGVGVHRNPSPWRESKITVNSSIFQWSSSSLCFCHIHTLAACKQPRPWHLLCLSTYVCPTRLLWSSQDAGCALSFLSIPASLSSNKIISQQPLQRLREYYSDHGNLTKYFLFIPSPCDLPEPSLPSSSDLTCSQVGHTLHYIMFAQSTQCPNKILSTKTILCLINNYSGSWTSPRAVWRFSHKIHFG